MTNYLLSHVTDSVLGRTGTTLDWPKARNGAIPASWRNFTLAPPLDWGWQNALDDKPRLFARNAMKPFAIYFVTTYNLILIAEPLAASVPDWVATIEADRSGTIAFGKRVYPYRFAALKHARLCREQSEYSAENTFDLYETSGYHIHGTRVQRGEQTAADGPKALRTNLRFSDYQEFRNFRRQSSGNRLVPTLVHIKTAAMPLAFSTGTDLYLSSGLANRVAEHKTPGLSFPYAPITVTGKHA